MKFGLIDFLNVLPLRLYIKKSNLPSYAKSTIFKKSAVPSAINNALNTKKFDCAIISSVKSLNRKYYKKDIGICANKKVLSVLVQKNTKQEEDKASASSNALAKILGLKGRVFIGDKALFRYLKSPQDYVDMCEMWHQKTNLPFCFARFCSLKNNDFRFFKRFDFLSNTPSKRIKIPSYLIEKYAKSRQISSKDIKNYLHFIYYHIGKKEKQALNLYAKQLKISKYFTKNH